MTFPKRRTTLGLAAAGFSALTSVFLVSASPAVAQPSAASAYLVYRADLESAESLEGFRAHLSSGLQKMLGFATERELASWLDKYKQKRLQSEVEILDEEPTEDGIRLRARGVGSSDGSPLLGRADMRLEDGSWRVIEEVWYPDFQPAASGSEADADYAKGIFRVNDHEVQMSHAYVRLQQYWADPDLPALELTISDREIDTDDYRLRQRSDAGELHYFRLTVSPEQVITGGMMYHQAYEGGYVSLVGVHELETTRFGPSVVEGRVFTKGPVAFSEVTDYSVAFRATILTTE